MMKQFRQSSFFSVFLGTICLTSCIGYCYGVEANSDSTHSPANQYQQPQGNRNSAPQYHEELAYNGGERRGNWDFKESWRGDRDIYYSGAAQTHAYQRNFRYRPTPGIGDPDDYYWVNPWFQNGYYLYNGRFPYPDYPYQMPVNQNPYYINQNPNYWRDPYYIDQDPYYNPDPYFINQNPY